MLRGLDQNGNFVTVTPKQLSQINKEAPVVEKAVEVESPTVKAPEAVAPAPGPVSPSGQVTRPMIMAKLKDLGVAFARNATLADLKELLEKAEKASGHNDL